MFAPFSGKHKHNLDIWAQRQASKAEIRLAGWMKNLRYEICSNISGGESFL
jgi:hypothetical protein